VQAALPADAVLEHELSMGGGTFAPHSATCMYACSHGYRQGRCCMDRRAVLRIPPTVPSQPAHVRQRNNRQHRQHAPAALQEQYKEARRKESTAMRGVKISIIPMFLYFVFILAAILYCYTRIRFGMGGLYHALKSYSYFVLAVEMLGAINMLFYGCWLFAKPVNDDVFPEANELVRLRLRSPRQLFFTARCR
jgi:hypothetical protein